MLLMEYANAEKELEKLHQDSEENDNSNKAALNKSLNKFMNTF